MKNTTRDDRKQVLVTLHLGPMRMEVHDKTLAWAVVILGVGTTLGFWLLT